VEQPGKPAASIQRKGTNARRIRSKKNDEELKGVPLNFGCFL
jgi:hypothetical protein